MGVVHEARDLELDRVVAIKQIRDRRAKSTRARARLRREAAAMAQLSHPNVVRIFDVVEDEGAIFVVMEFVDGDTLDVHLMRAGVDWRTLVPLFLGIGGGLAAIHARGLVHRDFKPANVLIAEDGTPRVTDFGLVQFPGDSSSANQSSGEEEEEEVVQDFLSPLTAPGMVAGTPKYMPPEQQQGSPVDEKADQYAFCLTFWEALSGFVPFRETDAARLLEAKKGGVPSSERPPAPAAVVDVLRRGLDPEPVKRWPSMHHLLEALEKTQRTRAAPWWVVPPLLIGAAMLAMAWRSEGTGCGDPEEALADVWGTPERDALAAALQGARPRITAATEAKLLEAIDGWSDEWLSAYSQACDVATGAERDSTLACLRRGRAQLGGTIEVLTTDDPAVLTRGLEMLAGLPRVDACDEAASEDGDDGRTAVVERAVARAEAFGRAAQHVEALDAVNGVLANLSCNEYPEHCVRLRMVYGRAYAGVNRFEDSSQAYEEAYAAALRAGDDRAAASAALALAFNESTYTPDFTAARRWLEHAESLAGRVEGDTASLRASVLSTKARLEVLTNHAREGLAHAEAAVDACLEQGRGDVACTHNLGTLGYAASNLGEYERAEKVQRRTIAALIEEVGADHHRTALQYGSLSRTLEHLGQDEEVLPLVEKEYEIYSRVHGEAHPRTISSRIMLAKHLTDREQPQRAREIVDEVLELCERHRELPDYVRASALTTGAYLDSSVGRHRDARKQTVSVLEITASLVGPDHPANGPARATLAGEERELGRFERAEEEFEQAEKLVAADPMYRATLYRDWVRLELDRGRVDEAETMLRRAEEAWAEREYLDPQVAAQRANLHGQIAMARGNAAAAREHFRNAMQLCAAGTLPHPSLRLEYALGFARAAVKLGDDTAALDVLDEAKAWATDQRPPQMLAEYEFVLAQALWPTRRADAKRHLTRAQETIQTAEGGYALRAEITMWTP